MVNFDEIEFLESEIVDDDDTAPVGTLIHITDDGKVEEVTPNAQHDETVAIAENLPVEENEEDVAPVSDEQEQLEEVTTDVDESDVAQEPVQESAKDVDEPLQDVVEEPQIVEEEPIQTVDEEPQTVEDVVEESVDETPSQPTIEPVSEQPTEIVEEETSQSDETTTAPEIAPVEDTAPEQAEQTASAIEESPAPTKKTTKPRKPAQKKAENTVVNDEEHKTSLNLKSGKSVNEELFGTSFEIEQPAKAKVVSTKKKQEKAEDLWAVATVTTSKKETSQKAEEPAPKAKAPSKAKKPAETAQTEPKKSASKKSTKVEDTNTSTEEKKVAKATDKTTKPAAEEKPVKATKTAKATKEAPVKETPAKEVPVKEEKAPKAAAKPTKDEETVLVEGEGKTHGKYVIKKTDKGNFVFKLYSSNYRVVAIGAQAYTTLGAAKIGVQSVIKNAENAPVENQTLKNYETLKFPKWEIYLDKKGEYRLRLYATNGSLIATTNDGYVDISGAKNGIAAVARASKGCAIVRNDDLW